MSPMSTFPTLLRREWLQHRLGWWLLGAAPLAVMVPLMLFGTIHMDHDGPSSPELVALTIAAGYTFFVLMLIGAAVVIQAPGLARRDRQDRSIEFWLSLPVGHVPSLGATLLMHWVLLPLLALGLAAAGAVLAGLIAVVRLHGFDGLAQLHAPALLALWLAVSARLALGLVLVAAWMSPFLLAGMAASAWLKRWGVPLLGGCVVILSFVLAHAYGQPWLRDQLAQHLQHAGWALLPTHQGHSGLDQIALPAQGVPELGRWLWEDTVLALTDLASLRFVAGLAVAAGGFALLVWRRQRG